MIRVGEMHRLMRTEMGNGGVADANVFRVTRHWLRRVPVQLADPRWVDFLNLSYHFIPLNQVSWHLKL